LLVFVAPRDGPDIAGPSSYSGKVTAQKVQSMKDGIEGFGLEGWGAPQNRVKPIQIM